MKLKDQHQEVEVKNTPLLEDLLDKWGYSADQVVEVHNLNEILMELSDWGIEWTRTHWEW